MTILVCGSRHWEDASRIRAELSKVYSARFKAERRLGATGLEFTVVHGGCGGADLIAGRAAAEIGCHVVEYRADWDTHGRAAGPMRNTEMLAKQPGTNVVLAFTDDPPGKKGSGTWDMVAKALARGIPVRLFSHRRSHLEEGKR